MARYTGPTSKIARKFGEAIFGEDKSFERKNYPPGQHGVNKRRGKIRVCDPINGEAESKIHLWYFRKTIP